MSIDLFFVAAPFLCRSRGAAGVSRRMTLAILVAGAFFLVMPLRFAFPDLTAGWRRRLRAAAGVRRPYNLFPSLHIAIRTILAGTYARHRRGPPGAVAAWFSLIGLSTVLTYQHHVIDVAGWVRARAGLLLPDPGTRRAAAGRAQPARRRLLRRRGGAVRWLGDRFRPSRLLLVARGLAGIVAGAYFGSGSDTAGGITARGTGACRRAPASSSRRG